MVFQFFVVPCARSRQAGGALETQVRHTADGGFSRGQAAGSRGPEKVGRFSLIFLAGNPPFGWGFLIFLPCG